LIDIVRHLTSRSYGIDTGLSVGVGVVDRVLPVSFDDERVGPFVEYDPTVLLDYTIDDLPKEARGCIEQLCENERTFELSSLEYLQESNVSRSAAPLAVPAAAAATTAIAATTTSKALHTDSKRSSLFPVAGTPQVSSLSSSSLQGGSGSGGSGNGGVATTTLSDNRANDSSSISLLHNQIFEPFQWVFDRTFPYAWKAFLVGRYLPT
jgi:hypothetical protein